MLHQTFLVPIKTRQQFDCGCPCLLVRSHIIPAENKKMLFSYLTSFLLGLFLFSTAVGMFHRIALLSFITMIRNKYASFKLFEKKKMMVHLASYSLFCNQVFVWHSVCWYENRIYFFMATVLLFVPI